MAKIVGVHGVGQQFEGEHSLKASWMPAIRDGLARAHRTLDRDDGLRCAFYGDLFRPSGKASFLPPLDANDVTDPLEKELLYAWWQEAARMDGAVHGENEPTKFWVPRIVQRALSALSHSSFFAGLAENALIFDLKQTIRYLTDKTIRQEAQSRVASAVEPDTQVIVAHSLGSVVAYETLCAHPEWTITALVTIGSPLGVRNVIFDKLIPAPNNDKGVWPGGTQHWINLADWGDIVALEKQLAPRFGKRLTDQIIDNGAKAHDATRYLTAKETGEAIALGL
jgi:hypothetical protein